MSRIVRIYEHGGPEVLRFEEIAESPPRPGEVTIAVKAIGLNRSEVMFRNGDHIETAVFPARLGYEATGIVVAVGSDVEVISVGDAVSLIPPYSVTRYGTYGETVTVPAEFVVRNPVTLSWISAAAIWMANVTAYGGLVDVGGFARGETALVLAASSSVGLATLGIARMIGGTVIATTRSSAKRQALLDAGAAHVVVTDEENLVERVMEITAGKGARIVFDAVAGPGIEGAIAAASQHGTLILYGALSNLPTPLPVLRMIAKGTTVRGFTFKEIVGDAQRRARAVAFILDGLANGHIVPTISSVFPFDRIADAQRALESGEQFGKIVVTLADDLPAMT